VLFIVAGALMFYFDTSLFVRIVGAAGSVFFAGFAALAIISLAIRAILRPIALLRVDTEGLTWGARYEGLGWFGVFQKRTVPWSNVAGLRIMDFQELALQQNRAAAYTSRPFGDLMSPTIRVKAVGVTPRDFEALVSAWPPPRRFVVRSFYGKLGMIPFGPVIGLSVEQLLEILEEYRNASHA
jgi:hypothetical protein